MKWHSLPCATNKAVPNMTAAKPRIHHVRIEASILQLAFLMPSTSPTATTADTCNAMCFIFITHPLPVAYRLICPSLCAACHYSKDTAGDFTGMTARWGHMCVMQNRASFTYTVPQNVNVASSLYWRQCWSSKPCMQCTLKYQALASVRSGGRGCSIMPYMVLTKGALRMDAYS